MTPEFFLDSSSNWNACEEVYSKKWPLSATSPIAEDVEVRGCAATPAPPQDMYRTSRYTKNCCEFSKSDHESMSWWHQSVDDGTAIDGDYDGHNDPCNLCPPYTCRTSKEFCVTPKFFLESSSNWNACEEVYSKKWPQSSVDPIAEDFEVRGCTDIKDPQAGTTTTDSSAETPPSPPVPGPSDGENVQTESTGNESTGTESTARETPPGGNTEVSVTTTTTNEFNGAPSSVVGLPMLVFVAAVAVAIVFAP